MMSKDLPIITSHQQVLTKEQNTLPLSTRVNSFFG